jgi:hypothetical protein
VIAFLAAACTDGPPTSVTDASAPNFSHKPGHNPGGGGGGNGDGGGTVEVEFLNSVSLFSSAPADYVSVAQTVKGSDSKRQIAINDVPFYLTLDSRLESASCVSAPGSELSEDDGRLANLVALTQPLTGLLGIHVRKKNFEGGQESETGVVVNFTYIDDAGAILGQAGDEFFLTTGKGANLLQEEQGQSRVAKTGGFVRINRNGDSKDAVICRGVVDFEFTVTK